MARVSMDSSIQTDIRIKKLTKLLGISRAETYGLLYLVWHECYLKTSDLATETDIDFAADEREGFAQAMFSVDLLELVGEKTYRVKGTEQRYDYIVRLRNNGKKGGRPRKPNGLTQNNQMVFSDKTPGLYTTSTSSSDSISSSSSVSSSDSISNSTVEKKKKEEGEAKAPEPTVPDAPVTKSKKSATPEEAAAMKLVFETYRSAYRHRYGIDPPDNGMLWKHIKQLVERVTPDAAPGIVEFYLSHSGSFYVMNKHAFRFCLQDCEKLRTELLTGNKSFRSNAIELEKRDQMAQTWAKIQREEI